MAESKITESEFLADLQTVLGLTASAPSELRAKLPALLGKYLDSPFELIWSDEETHQLAFKSVSPTPKRIQILLDIIEHGWQDQQMQFQAKQAAQARQQELSDAIKHLRQTQKKLINSEKTIALGGLVVGVAHELNTPLGICVTAASILLEGLDEIKANTRDLVPAEQWHDLSDAGKLLQAQLNRSVQLVQNFKLLSVDQFHDQVEIIELPVFFEELRQVWHSEAKHRGVNLQIDCQVEQWLSYPSVLFQILGQFFWNSLRHGFQGISAPEIQIQVALKQEERQGGVPALLSLLDQRLQKHSEGGQLSEREQICVISFSDNGIGIRPEIQKRIFEPFFTSNPAQYAGLGLHIVENFVTQKLNGSVRFTPMSAGANFEILLPLMESTAEETL